MTQVIEGQFSEMLTTKSVDNVLDVASLLDAYPFDRGIVAEHGTTYILQYGIRTKYEGAPFIMTTRKRSLFFLRITYRMDVPGTMK